MSIFDKFFGDKKVDQAGTPRHVYMTVGPVLHLQTEEGRRNQPDWFFANYRGMSSTSAGFRRQMERQGYKVVSCKERFGFEEKGGPRGRPGVWLDANLSPVPKMEVVK